MSEGAPQGRAPVGAWGRGGGRLRLCLGGLQPENWEEALVPLACSMEPPPHVVCVCRRGLQGLLEPWLLQRGSAPGIHWAAVPSSLVSQMSRQGV